MTKPIGRPPSPATLEARRVEAMLKNMPPHLPKLTEVQKSELNESFAHDERIRQEILKTFKHGRTTPDSHAYDMASIGDESLIGHEQKILDEDAKFALRAKRYRQSGAAATKDKTADRKANIKKNNHRLISKIQPSSRYTLHSVAQMIHDQWEEMTPAQKISGECSMARRGDGKERPSVSTIRRWIEP